MSAWAATKPICSGHFYEDTAADEVAKEILADYLSGAACPGSWAWMRPRAPAARYILKYIYIYIWGVLCAIGINKKQFDGFIFPQKFSQDLGMDRMIQSSTIIPLIPNIFLKF